MHLPPHPASFWLIVTSPLFFTLALWALRRIFQISLKPLAPWLKGIVFILLAASIFLDAADNHKNLRLVCESLFNCAAIGLALTGRQKFASLRNPNATWFLPWAYARFTIPTNVRIVVREANSLSPWYAEKLGLRKLIDPPRGDNTGIEFKFTADGNSVVLTTKKGLLPPKTLILFTKRIGRMRDALAARGVYAEPIDQDRQGIRYFNIHDPEGNVIEVVEDR